MQALHSRRHARLAGMGPPIRRRRARHASHRGRGHGPRRRTWARPPPRLQPTASQQAADCRGRSRAISTCSSVAGPDGADPARDDAATRRRSGFRSGVLKRPAVQRDDPGGLCPYAHGAAGPSHKPTWPKRPVGRSGSDRSSARLPCPVPAVPTIRISRRPGGSRRRGRRSRALPASALLAPWIRDRRGQR